MLCGHPRLGCFLHDLLANGMDTLGKEPHSAGIRIAVGGLAHELGVEIIEGLHGMSLE
ncbi:unannotated protein [freshwater metagenome]|uniref:Unannotated protein n=1 Tax=freshwater metagenome TaxID=449393 RepID=A0A6J7NKD9_9ZZZZ